MKILIILPNLGGGGAERLALNLAEYWIDKGFNIAFALFRAEGVLLSDIPEKAVIYDLKATTLKSSLWALRRVIADYKPFFLWANMWPVTCIAVASWMLSFCTGRIVLTDHIHLSTEARQNLKMKYWKLKLSILVSYPFASFRTAVSTGVCQDLQGIMYPLRLRVDVINNCVKSYIFSELREKILLPASWSRFTGKRIICVGSLKRQKNHRLLIESFSILQSLTNERLMLAIVGEGELRSELESLVLTLGLSDRILLPGFFLDPAPWYMSADLFVLSSDWEGFGNVLIEALSFGVPVVSTDCESGPREILKDGLYGELVPTKDATSLSLAISKSLGAVHDKMKLIERANDYSVDKIGQKYLSLVQQKIMYKLK